MLIGSGQRKEMIGAKIREAKGCHYGSEVNLQERWWGLDPDDSEVARVWMYFEGRTGIVEDVTEIGE
jgi:hypothetical protein